MKKRILAVLLAAIVVLAGCTPATGGSKSSESGSESIQDSVSASQEDGGELPEREDEEEWEEPTEAPMEVFEIQEQIDQQLEGLRENEYEGLTVTAAVLERKAILPGSAIPVTVTVSNTGDKAVAYVQGSGSQTIPSALMLNVVGLQPVIPQDRLGAMTMDFQIKLLEPGETLSYIWYVMAIASSMSFDRHTMDLYGDGETYMADLPWEEIQSQFPDLNAAEPGSYSGAAYFSYTLVDGGEIANTEPTGYAQGEILIGVSD